MEKVTVLVEDTLAGLELQKKIVALIEQEFPKEAIVVPGVVKQVHS